MLEAGRQEAAAHCNQFVLVLHDWSLLRYGNHASKADRVALSSTHKPDGYELYSAILASDRDGLPLAPAVLSLRAADGVHCSRCDWVRTPASPLDELDPAMSFIEEQRLPFPLVHVIDAEADSVWHYRQWTQRPDRLFVVRCDDRIATFEGHECRFSAIRQQQLKANAFRKTRPVRYRGRAAEQWIAEVSVTLTRPAQRNRPGRGDRQRIPGPPVTLRLIISEVRDAQGQVLAIWYLLSNVPAEQDAATIALWYYWRWTIESYFKLLKSAGMHAESWQQETAAAIARRLLVASMACVCVWRLAHSTHPQADATRRLLVRLSGRQMKHRCAFTLPAMLAGLWSLLAMLEVLETHSVDELRELAELVMPHLAKKPP